MNKPKKRITNRELLIELLKSNAALDAHLYTLFAMQCELFAYFNKTPSARITEKWGKFRADLLKQNLNDLKDQFKGRE